MTTFAERKWKQLSLWSTSSLGVKSSDTDFGEVRAILSFQSNLSTVLALSQSISERMSAGRFSQVIKTRKKIKISEGVVGLGQKSQQVPYLEFHCQETVLV